MIQKQSKALSFRPFLQLVARKYGDASPETYDIFGGSLPDDLSHTVKMSLMPGPNLDDLSLRMGKRVLVDIDAFLESGKTHLLKWSRHAIVQATSCAVYGEKHPFQDPEVESAYWSWMPYLSAHLVGWLDITGKGYALRDKVFKAYIKYCGALPAGTSHLMKEHQRLLDDAGVPPTDKAKQAAIFTIASFSNSAPTLYWTLWELFSRPDILAQVRAELAAHAVIRNDGRDGSDGSRSFTLDVAALKHHCPLLLSVFQETQRTRHVNPSFRKVMTDVVLDNKYLLKAGSYLQVPGNVIHGERGIWGAEAAEFDPYRFVPGHRDAKQNGAGADASGFVPWGAAPYLCPARQFAAVEIMIVAALLAMRADLHPVGGDGKEIKWDRSPPLNFSDLSTLSPPKKDVPMRIAVREEWAGKWSLKMGESRSRVPLASG